MAKSSKTIFSFGHSNKPIATFLATLKKHRIDILADVRTIPLSRYCPHFNENALRRVLPDQNIQYLWRGKNLGGRGVNVRYEETIDELSEMAKNGTRVCVMCSEADYKKCHRYLTLTPSFKKQGLSVTHIQYENEKKPNRHK